MIKVSFIIPTLNAGKVLKKCLDSIRIQNLPKNEYEIIIADGGSTDDTLKIAKKYQAIIIDNPLKTAEAGKAVGVKKAKGKFIALIDSDNILSTKNWLTKSLLPLQNNRQIIGTEPVSFTYRSESGYMERYSALLGANDPYAFITGVYDRFSYVNHKWTKLKLKVEENKNYYKIYLQPNQQIPTIGANGTIFRTSFINKYFDSKYLFDIDLISLAIRKSKQELIFAKTKNSIIHTYCESSFKKFIRKQKRRLIDFYQYQPLRQYNWSQTNQSSVLKFILYTLLVFPAIIDSVRGFLHKRDLVWFIHPIACYTTLIIYVTISLQHKFGLLKPINRKLWKQ